MIAVQRIEILHHLNKMLTECKKHLHHKIGLATFGL